MAGCTASSVRMTSAWIDANSALAAPSPAAGRAGIGRNTMQRPAACMQVPPSTCAAASGRIHLRCPRPSPPTPPRAPAPCPARRTRLHSPCRDARYSRRLCIGHFMPLARSNPGACFWMATFVRCTKVLPMSSFFMVNRALVKRAKPLLVQGRRTPQVRAARWRRHRGKSGLVPAEAACDAALWGALPPRACTPPLKTRIPQPRPALPLLPLESMQPTCTDRCAVGCSWSLARRCAGQTSCHPLGTERPHSCMEAGAVRRARATCHTARHVRYAHQLAGGWRTCCTHAPTTPRPAVSDQLRMRLVRWQSMATQTHRCARYVSAWSSSSGFQVWPRRQSLI